jgi:C-terminal peptidase prc
VRLVVERSDSPEPVEIVLERGMVRLPGADARSHVETPADGRPRQVTTAAGETRVSTPYRPRSSGSDRSPVIGPIPRSVPISVDRSRMVLPVPTVGRAPPVLASAPSVEEPRIQVITLTAFYSDLVAREAGQRQFKSTARDVWRLIRQRGVDNISGLLLDLRGNRGGSMAEAIELAGLFLSGQSVVQVRSALTELKVHSDPDIGFAYRGPLVILVDHRTASAAELATAALQDHGRAIVVGRSQTYGKGTVQTLLRISAVARVPEILADGDPGTLKLTTAKFYRPAGGAMQLRGVTPDVLLQPPRAASSIRTEGDLAYALAWDAIPATADCPETVGHPTADDLQQRYAARAAALAPQSERRQAVAVLSELIRLSAAPTAD